METSNNNKTSPAQIKASLNYYYKNKNEINEKEGIRKRSGKT